MSSKTFAGANFWASVALVALLGGATSPAWGQADAGPEDQNTGDSFEVRDGVYFLEGQETPFSGVYTIFDDEGTRPASSRSRMEGSTGSHAPGIQGDRKKKNPTGKTASRKDS